MFGFGEAQEHYENAQNEDTASWGHEAIAGAAGFGAMKLFEERQRKEGKPVSHQFAKELLAGFASAEVDKLAETKGEDWVREHRVREQAERQSHELYDQHYGDQDQYDPNQRDPPQEFNNYRNGW